MPISAAPVETLIGETLFLLDHAQTAGKPVPGSIITPILVARDAKTAGTLTAAEETDFRVAAAQLAALMQPVTVDSLSPECLEAAHKERISYFRKVTWLLAFILPFSLLSFGVSWLSKDITDMLEAECRLEAALYCSSAPAAARTGTPAATLIDPAALNRANVLLFYRIEWLNILTFYSVDKERISYLYGHEATQDFQNIYVVAQDLLKRNRLIYGAISGYILPIMYAMLGAVAYGIRNLSEQTIAKTVLPSSFLRARMRFRLAVLAGVIIGLFQDFGSASLSPLAVAFLVGYAVEIFFSFLDSTVQTLRRSAPEAVPTQPAVRAPPAT